MKKTHIAIALMIPMLAYACSQKLDDAGVKTTLDRFVRENELVHRFVGNTGKVGSIGPILASANNEIPVDFTIKYIDCAGKTWVDDLVHKCGDELVEHAVAIFSRTQDGKWILSKVVGKTWELGWRVDGINWEINSH